jgi:hypothetical protein
MRVAAWVFLVAVIWSTGAAEAAEWTIVKLHGMVYAEAAGGQWVRLSRGDAVADGHVIRTLRNGNAVVARGAETISLGPGTQAEITDRPGSRPFTTVREETGSIGVAAEARAVRHFSVETPYLVAVVKGTRFTVSTNDQGSSVAVARGLVAVTTRAGRRTVMLPAGQRVLATRYGGMLVSGTAVPALVHSRIGGVVEDADVGDMAPAAGPADGLPLLGGLGSATTDLGAVTGGTVTALGGVTGDTLTGVTSAAGGLVQTAGSSLGALGGAGPLGSTVSTAGATLGGVGETVGAVGAAAGGAVTTVTGTAGDALTGVTSAVGKTVTGLTQGSAGTAGAGGGLLHRLGL